MGQIISQMRRQMRRQMRQIDFSSMIGTYTASVVVSFQYSTLLRCGAFTGRCIDSP
jgi:hypothetical protein